MNDSDTVSVWAFCLSKKQFKLWRRSVNVVSANQIDLNHVQKNYTFRFSSFFNWNCFSFKSKRCLNCEFLCEIYFICIQWIQELIDSHFKKIVWWALQLQQISLINYTASVFSADAVKLIIKPRLESIKKMLIETATQFAACEARKWATQ